MTTPSVKYIALDTFHHNGTTYGPKSEAFELLEHDAKHLLESGLVKTVKVRGEKAAEPASKPSTITGGSFTKEKPAAVKFFKAAPDNKKRDLKKGTK